MRIDCALLCDAVTVRDGLLHILGGGVTRVSRPEYPGPLGIALALRVMVHPTEAEREHKLEARLISEDGADVGRIDVQFSIAGNDGVRPGEEFSAAIPLPVNSALMLPSAGAYSFEILIDGTHMTSVPFVAVIPEEVPGDEG